jgi:hypothetical protein
MIRCCAICLRTSTWDLQGRSEQYLVACPETVSDGNLAELPIRLPSSSAPASAEGAKRNHFGAEECTIWLAQSSSPVRASECPASTSSWVCDQPSSAACSGAARRWGNDGGNEEGGLAEDSWWWIWKLFLEDYVGKRGITMAIAFSPDRPLESHPIMSEYW